jgi:hypothetical protein
MCVIGSIHVSAEQLSTYNSLTHIYGNLNVEGVETDFENIQFVSGEFTSKNREMINEFSEMFDKNSYRKSIRRSF